MAKMRDTHYHSGLGQIESGDPDRQRNFPAFVTMRQHTITIIWFTLSFFVMSFFCAEKALAEGDAEQGEQLGYTCLGCHGIEGYRNAYPSFRVPKLGGQGSAYLQTALRAYRDGTRAHPTMYAQASSMSDEDIENLVAWIAGAGDVADTATMDSIPAIAGLDACVACHGTDGEGVVPQPPTLAGQHQDYLEYALEQYQSGARPGTVMSAFVAALGDADIASLAAYYAAADGLQTLE